MRAALLLGTALILASQPPTMAADDGVYEGSWRTTNRKLDGTMTCVVRDQQGGKWTGRFYGIWQGVPFDYTVPFTGNPDKLTGKATIDGADYTWTGDMTTEEGSRFKGTFGGNRYAGYFDLKRKQPSATASARTPTVR